MTNLVQQRTDFDCVFCCLAMSLGLTYDQAAERAGAGFMELLNKRGCDGDMEDALYRAFGLRAGIDYVDMKYSPHWGTVAYTRNLLWGRRACVTVRSKNNADSWHMLFWDGAQVHDPRQVDKKRYTDWAECEPTEMVIFSETAPRLL